MDGSAVRSLDRNSVRLDSEKRWRCGLLCNVNDIRSTQAIDVTRIPTSCPEEGSRLAAILMWSHVSMTMVMSEPFLARKSNGKAARSFALSAPRDTSLAGKNKTVQREASGLGGLCSTGSEIDHS